MRWTPHEAEPDTRSVATFLARSQDAFEGAAVPILVVVGPEAAVCFANASARGVFGAAPVSLADLGVSPELQRRLIAGAGGEGVWQGPLAGGTATVVPIPGEDAVPAGLVVAFATGFSASFHPDDAAAAFPDGEDPLVWIGAAGCVLFANAPATRLLGPRLLGRPAPTCLPAGACAALATGGFAVDRLLAHGSGAIHHVSWAAVTLPARGAPALTVLRARDVSAAQQLAARGWSDTKNAALHAVALAVGNALPTLALAELALTELAPIVTARELRVTLIEGDTLRVLTALRDNAHVHVEGRSLLALSPASLARAERVPVQCVVAHAGGAWPALQAFGGIRGVLYAPLVVAEAMFGCIEVYSDVRDAFPADDVAFVQQIAGMLATALLRERVLEQATRHAQDMELRAALRGEELNRTQEQLIQAARLSSIGELAAGLVHEINQPLNVLGGYVELLREGALAEGARERALDVMGRAVDRMITMVDNLRNFARAGGPALGPVDVAGIIRVARELTSGAQRRGVQVFCPADLTVLGDGNRLEQVLINLIANALQADGDPVIVTGRELDAGRIAIEVADRGPGVPQGLRTRIFDPFFTTKPPGQGTGLGLSVSGRIIQDHNGRIEVLDNPGGGAIFRVVLPRYVRRGGDLPS